MTIRSDQGVAMLKLADLSLPMQARLKGQAAPPRTATNAAPRTPVKVVANTNATGSAPDSSSERAKALLKKLLDQFPAEQTGAGLYLAVLAIFLLFYFGYCYCLMLICKKTGNEPGLLVWLPILQEFPKLRAAGMSGWWFLGYFIPVLNLVTWILWCVKITQARGKGMLTALFLILPITSFFAFLYLAFSSAAEEVPQSMPAPARRA